MLSKRAGVTVLVLFLTAAAIAAYIGTSLLMPASAHPNPPPMVPERPTGISISQDENGVTLQWDDPGDKSVTRYRIVRTMIQDGRPVLTSITDWRDRGKQSYTDSRGLPNTTYTYQIWAKNAVGESQGSDVITVRTVRTPTNTQGATAPRADDVVEGISPKPGAPTWTGGGGYSHNSLTPGWDAPSYTGGSAITSYNLKYKESTATNWGATITGIVNRYKHIYGLNPSTEYDFQVQAVNSFGAGPWSTTNTLRTSVYRPPPPPNRPPYFLTDNDYSITVAENTPAGQEIGDPIAARDPDGSDSSLNYTLEGTDAAAFEVIKDTSNRGQVKTKDPLNHEEQSEYDLTIRVRDSRRASASHALAVSVTDLQEPGSVTLAPTQPTVGESVAATLNDEDERTSPSWQWTRADSDSGDWSDITGAAHPSYTPESEDLGKYLQATATYNDINIDQTASAITSQVIDPTLKSLKLSPVGHQQLPAKPAQLRGGHGQQRLPGHRHRCRLPPRSEPQLQPNRRRRQHRRTPVEPIQRPQPAHHHRHRRRGLPGVPDHHWPGRDGRIRLEGPGRPQHPDSQRRTSAPRACGLMAPPCGWPIPKTASSTPTT